MTILAGVFSRRSAERVPDSICDALRKSISRDPADVPIEFRDARAFLLKVDIGAFARPAHRVSSAGSFAMLAGEPLLTSEGAGGDRHAQLAFLHADWDGGRFQSLRSASGTFCAACYDPRTHTLHLIADRLGLRPLYYAVVDDLVYFASALRIFEALAAIPKTMDVCSVAEMTGFGYPFAGGTPYAGITMLQACEIVTIRDSDLASSRYFAWDSIAPLKVGEEDALHETFGRFRSAVRRRLRGDRTVIAYLSGGLDSRCTVAALRAERTDVHTFNFSQAGTQDQVFGADFAARIGAMHDEVPADPGPDWSAIMARASRASPRVRERTPEHPALVWSGEGGSVGLGHVYLTPEIVDDMRGGDLAGAVGVFLRQQQKNVPTRILNRRLGRQLRGYLHARLCREIDAIDYPDRLRAFYIFLILNGPRRHLEGHFDNIDRHRIEFQMPFNDSAFLEYVTALDVEPCLYHRFYVRWLSLFDPAVLAVPWQAYPGHVPSPIPISRNLPDQWTAPRSRSHEMAFRAELLEQSAAMLSDAGFPRALLRKTHLRLMRWAWRLNLGNYAYALTAGLTYYRYWKIAGGNCELPAPRL